MNHPLPIKPRACDNLRRAKEIDAIVSAGAYLAAKYRQFPNRPMCKTVLWAEHSFAKAQYDHFGDEATLEALDNACAELGVDHDGDPVAGEAA